MKIDVSPTRGTFHVVERSEITGTFTISNAADVAVTGLRYEIVGKPDNVEVQVEWVGDSLGVFSKKAVNVTVKANDMSIPAANMTLRILSDQAPAVEIPLTVNVYSAVPTLTASVKSLNTAMVPGSQKKVEFTLTNDSGTDSGPIEFVFPNGTSWMTSMAGNTLPSLSPGESTTVTLLLSPTKGMQLTKYEGSFVVKYSGTGISMPFAFRAVSEAKGDLVIHAVDEYFYFTEEKPSLAGASVQLYDAVTKQLVSTGTTDAGGKLRIAQLPEGYYDVKVQCDKHDTYMATIYVETGDNDLEAFLPRQTVRYEWTVTPTTIEDKYEINLEAIFEMNVPAPVVTLDNANIDLSDLLYVGQKKQVNLTYTNHGLISGITSSNAVLIYWPFLPI